jgi:hypothetical protein
MRQRGAQSRRRSGLDGGTFGAPLGSGGGRQKFWPTVAMIAIVVATAGWTTVAVLALSGRGEASPGPTQFADVAASDDPSLEPDLESPEPESHVSPSLEALLPKLVEGTALTTQSWSGDDILIDDGWSDTFRTFLQGASKSPGDLLVAQAYDPGGTLDFTVGVFKISAVTAADVAKTLVSANMADAPELTSTTATVGGKKVTQGGFADTGPESYLYEHEDLVYDVETTDADLAAKILALLP